MTTIIDGSAGITFPNSTIQASAGSVLQVVNATFTAQASTSSTSYVTTGYSASITPKFNNSKIFVVFNGRTNITASGINIAFYRGATNITGTTGYVNYVSSGTQQNYTSLNWLDSPATASATTYTIYFSNSGSGTVQINPNPTADFPATITLMEIAG